MRLLAVQKTLQKSPMLRAARHWREDEAPPEFLHTLKAWRLITHEPSSPTCRKHGLDTCDEARDGYISVLPTHEVFDAVVRMRGTAEALMASAVLLQCTATVDPTAGNREKLRIFFDDVDHERLTCAWELHGAGEAAEIATLCEDLRLVHCVDPFRSETVTEDLDHFRLHGIDNYYDNYTDDELEQVGTRCEPFQTTSVLLDSDSMWEDALRLREMLGQR